MNLDGSGVITNYHLSAPDNKWYTTVEENEVIPFVDHYDILRNINDWIVFANTTNLLFRMCIVDNATDKNVLYESDVLFVDAGASRSNGKIRFNAIKIIGVLGKEVAYSANFY